MALFVLFCRPYGFVFFLGVCRKCAAANKKNVNRTSDIRRKKMDTKKEIYADGMGQIHFAGNMVRFDFVTIVATLGLYNYFIAIFGCVHLQCLIISTNIVC